MAQDQKPTSTVQQGNKLECVLGHHIIPDKWTSYDDGSKFRECACGHLIQIMGKDGLIICGTRHVIQTWKL